MNKNIDYLKSIESAERRFFKSEVKFEKREEGSSGEVNGYAAKFNSIAVIGNWFREMVMPGAFDDVLKDDVRCLFNHDPSLILARCKDGVGTLSLSTDDIGLKYAYVSPNRSYAKDLEDAIEAGDVSQSSFGFRIEEEEWVEEEGMLPLRKIKRFKKLYDVSPVTFPAYADTEVAKRSLEVFEESRKPNDLDLLKKQIQINNNL